MSYIGYTQVEDLLRKYYLLKALLYNLQIELRKIWKTGNNDTISEEDILYSLAIGNKVLSDMPHAGSRASGDKELGIILTKDRIIGEDIREMFNAVDTIGEVVEKTTSALKGIPAEQSQILTEFYCQRKTWKDIATTMNMERDTLKERRRESIDTILKVLRITPEQWEFCLRKLEGKRESEG